MTIRQLYYTSCRHGTEGIQGFQVNAATPGIDRAHVDTGLQLSLYRPSRSAPSLPTPAQLDALPVAVGYRACGDFAVLFHSRYLGADFTGRQGNYFAHVLVLDAPDQDLAGMLPVDAWGSPMWNWTEAERTELPVLAEVPRGALARRTPGADLRAGRLPEFAGLLGAVQDGLQRRGRIVLVAPSDEAVARAVAAVTRSLPRTLATAVSFVTFTSAPGEADVLIAGTSADVAIPANPLGDRTVVRLGNGSRGVPDATPYARVLEACWLRSDDEADEAVTLASSIRPSVEAGELDELSNLIELVVLDTPRSGPILDVLPALEFGLRRWPAVLRAPVWAKVAHHVQSKAPITDTSRWSAVLAATRARGMEPPPVLLDAYLTAVLTAVVDDGLDPATVWMPDPLTGPHERTALDWAAATLDRSPSIAVASAVLETLVRVKFGLPEATLRHLVGRVVVPHLVDPTTAGDAAAEFNRMATRTPSLPGLVCAELDRRVAEPGGFRLVAAALPPVAAELLGPHAPRSSRCALAFDVVRARAGVAKRGRLSVLSNAVRNGRAGATPADVQMLVELLWPTLPSAAEAVALCRAVEPDLLARTGIPAWLAGRLAADARGPGLDADDLQLAEELGNGPVADSLGAERPSVWAVRDIQYFRTSPPHVDDNADAAVRAVDGVGGVIPELRKQTLLTVAAWICAAPDALAHAQVLGRVLTEARYLREFVGAYRVALTEVLRDGRPAAAAAVLPALAFLGPRHQPIQKMLDTTAAMVLTGRSKRDREGITKAIGGADRRLRPLLREMGRKAPKSWPVWWDDWQHDHLRTSLMSRIIARRRTARAVD